MNTEQPILFFCKDCQKVITDPQQKGKKYEYMCPTCKRDRVAFGTRKAICDYFHIKDAQLEKMLSDSSNS